MRLRTYRGCTGNALRGILAYRDRGPRIAWPMPRHCNSAFDCTWVTKTHFYLWFTYGSTIDRLYCHEFQLLTVQILPQGFPSSSRSTPNFVTNFFSSFILFLFLWFVVSQILSAWPTFRKFQRGFKVCSPQRPSCRLRIGLFARSPSLRSTNVHFSNRHTSQSFETCKVSKFRKGILRKFGRKNFPFSLVLWRSFRFTDFRIRGLENAWGRKNGSQSESRWGLFSWRRV